MSGEHLTQELQKLLNDRATGAAGNVPRDSVRKTFTTTSEVDQIRIMKESMTYCVENFDHAMSEATESKACEKAYILPDGGKIILGKERFCCSSVFLPIPKGEK